MKKILIVLFIIILTSSVNAGLPIPFKVYAGGGLTIPSTMPFFSDNWKTGFHINGGLGMSILPKLQLLLKTEIHKFELDGVKANFGDFETPEFIAVLVGLEGSLSFGNPVTKIKPFLLLGGGVAITSYSAFDIADYEASTGNIAPNFTDANKLYYNIGVGVDLKSISLFTIFAQLQLMQIMTKDETTQFIPLTIGIKFN